MSCAPVEHSLASTATTGVPALTRELSLEAYRRMVRIRRFEEEAMRRAMAGEFSGMHSSSGQEAAIVGACLAKARISRP